MRNRISSSSFPAIWLFFFFSLGLAALEAEHRHSSGVVDDADKIRAQFLHLLRTRRSPQVRLTVEPAKPVLHPLFQGVAPPPLNKSIVSCPKADIENPKERLKEENLYLRTEAAEQGRLPVLILSSKDSNQTRRPAVVFLHATNTNKEWLRPLLEAYASREYIAIAIDSRYHGERAHHQTTYQDALVSSWKKGDTMPFIFDTLWDLIKLADYLSLRKDIDASRIGITGISLGGMHAWFAAFADTRYTVAVPIIGVQGFRWAIDNDKWQARVDTIKAVFEEARIDLGKSAIDKEVVEKVWDRIAPGLASQFDSPYSIPAIAPRPLLILNGADDPHCPLDGIRTPEKRARKAYRKAHSSNNFKRIWDRLMPSNTVTHAHAKSWSCVHTREKGEWHYHELVYSCVLFPEYAAHRTTWNRPPIHTVNGERSMCLDGQVPQAIIFIVICVCVYIYMYQLSVEGSAVT